MAAGIALRNATRTAINLLGNTVTITQRTVSAYNVRGDVIWTTGSASNVTAATTNNIIPKYVKLIAGDIQSGDLVVYVKDSDTINSASLITFNSINYRIDSLKPISVENVLVVNVATCYKSLS